MPALLILRGGGGGRIVTGHGVLCLDAAGRLNNVPLRPRWSYAEGSLGLLLGALNHAGLACGRGARQRQYPGPPDWGLGAGLTTLLCKAVVTETLRPR